MWPFAIVAVGLAVVGVWARTPGIRTGCVALLTGICLVTMFVPLHTLHRFLGDVLPDDSLERNVCLECTSRIQGVTNDALVVIFAGVVGLAVVALFSRSRKPAMEKRDTVE